MPSTKVPRKKHATDDKVVKDKKKTKDLGEKTSKRKKEEKKSVKSDDENVNDHVTGDTITNTKVEQSNTEDVQTVADNNEDLSQQNNARQYRDEYDEPVGNFSNESAQPSNKHVQTNVNVSTQERSKRPSNSVLKFDYKETDALANVTLVKDLDTSELLKCLIARTHREGQTGLCNIFKNCLTGLAGQTQYPMITVNNPNNRRRPQTNEKTNKQDVRYERPYREQPYNEPYREQPYREQPYREQPFREQPFREPRAPRNFQQNRYQENEREDPSFGSAKQPVGSHRLPPPRSQNQERPQFNRFN